MCLSGGLGVVILVAGMCPVFHACQVGLGLWSLLRGCTACV